MAVGGDDHALEHAEGKRLEDHPVHEGARVAFVTVADDVLRVSPGRAGDVPLAPCWEARAAPSAQPAVRELGDHFLGRLFPKARLQGLKAVVGEIVVEAVRVQDPGVLGDELHLRAGIAFLGPLADVRREARGRNPRVVGEEVLQQLEDEAACALEPARRLEVAQEQRAHLSGLHASVTVLALVELDDLDHRGLERDAGAGDVLDAHRQTQALDDALQFGVHLARTSRPCSSNTGKIRASPAALRVTSSSWSFPVRVPIRYLQNRAAGRGYPAASTLP